MNFREIPGIGLGAKAGRNSKNKKIKNPQGDRGYNHFGP